MVAARSFFLVRPPQDIEGITGFLALDESPYRTRGLYMCDGGLTASVTADNG
jgi:hypothetical protein